MTEIDLNTIANTLLESTDGERNRFLPPDLRTVKQIIHDIRTLLLPEYYMSGEDDTEAYKALLFTTYHNLKRQVRAAYQFSGLSDEPATEVCDALFAAFPELQRLLRLDLIAGFDGDPAAKSYGEVALSYPGFFAISTYRIAHELYEAGVPYLPRMMTEYAHNKTGIDINPGAKIGESFFIDHGTGIVIGETTEIGNNVKVYQGVTLGALSLRKGQSLKGTKRHPTIGDNVTIYSNASVLGGETVVGEGSVIAGSTFVTESVPPNSRVTVNGISTRVDTRANSQTGPQYETV